MSGSPTPTHSADGVIDCGQSVSGSTVGAGDDFLVGVGRGTSQGADISYLFTAPILGSYVFSTCNQTSYDSIIEVFTASPLVSVGFSDDEPGCSSFSSHVTIDLEPASHSLSNLRSLSRLIRVVLAGVIPRCG